MSLTLLFLLPLLLIGCGDSQDARQDAAPATKPAPEATPGDVATPASGAVEPAPVDTPAGAQEDTLARIARARAAFAAALAPAPPSTPPDTPEGTPQEPPQRTPEPPFEGWADIEALFKQRRYDDVIAALEQIIAAQPELTQPRMLLALAHHKSKRYAQARPMFEAVLERGPVLTRPAGPFYYYGYCLYYLGEPAAARASFEAFLAFAERDDFDAHFGIALCEIDLGELESARTHLRRSLALLEEEPRTDPHKGPGLAQGFAKAHARLGDIALEEQDLATARVHYEACVRAYPLADEVWFQLHRTYARLGEDELAAQAKERYDYLMRIRTGGRP